MTKPQKGFAVITAIVLIGSSVRSRKNSGLPASLGLNYFREER